MQFIRYCVEPTPALLGFFEFPRLRMDPITRCPGAYIFENESGMRFPPYTSLFLLHTTCNLLLLFLWLSHFLSVSKPNKLYCIVLPFKGGRELTAVPILQLDLCLSRDPCESIFWICRFPLKTPRCVKPRPNGDATCWCNMLHAFGHHVAFVFPTLLNMLQRDPTMLHPTCCTRFARALFAPSQRPSVQFLATPGRA